MLNLIGELDMWVNQIQVGMELFLDYEMLMDAGVALVDIPVPPFRWVRGGCDRPLFNVLITGFARMALMGEPMGHPKTCW